MLRSLEYFLPATFLLGMVNPLLIVPGFGIAYFIFLNSVVYEVSRRLVVRMDLLPERDALIVQKIGAFGKLYSKEFRVENLEKVCMQNLREKGIDCLRRKSLLEVQSVPD